MDGCWTKGQGAAVEEEHAEGEGPSSPSELRQSPDVHFISEPEAGPSVSVPPSLSHTMPSFSLGEDEMGLLVERVAGILSV